MKIDRFLFVCICMMMLCACASSRKTMTKVSASGGDSVVVIMTDSAAVSVVRKDSAKVDRWNYSQIKGNIFGYNDDEELIHELITVATDSLGNKTTTTDRTIHRKNHNGKQTTTSEEQRRHEEQTSVFLSALDSIAHSRFSKYYTHWQNQDSVAQSSEKNTDTTRKFSPLRRIEDAVIFLAVVALLGWLVARRINNKGMFYKLKC